MICLICKKELKRAQSHFFRKHNMSVYEYFDLYFKESYDVVKEYQIGKSALEISKEIKDLNIGFSFGKKEIYSFLRFKNVEIRNTSEATLGWLSKKGIWNKGLTKETSESVKKYSESRMGENNPYFKASEESKKKINWHTYKKQEEIFEIHKKIGESIKDGYESGRIISKWNDSEYSTNMREKMRMAYKKRLDSGDKFFLTNLPESTLERKLSNFLIERQIRFIKQYFVRRDDKERGWYKFDYCLPDLNVLIEFNGTYWHCDPRKYDENYYHSVKGMTSKQLWENDRIKKELGERLGFNVKVIWEKDVEKLTEEEYKRFFYEILEN